MHMVTFGEKGGEEGGEKNLRSVLHFSFSVESRNLL